MNKPSTGARVRAAAADAVHGVLVDGRSLDVALAAAEEQVAPGDHALLRMLSFGTLRSCWQLQEWAAALVERPLRKRDSVIQSLLLVGLFQLTDTRIPDHAAVSATVEAARALRRPKFAGLVNAVLRRFMRESMAAATPGTDEARFNHPSWLIDAIQNDWPDDWQAILAANNERAPMWLRVNSQRITAADYQARLKALELAADLQPGWPQALCLSQPIAVAGLPGFDAGDVSVQDAAAQLAAPWLLDGQGGRILDACAAPGGKSAHLKELAGDGIDLTCVDIEADRALSIASNLERLGLAATIKVGDASNPEQWLDPDQPATACFDGILLDAPCSASGVIRRHPDIKHLRRASDIDQLASLQAAILRALWPLVAPGGRLLYVTCSVLSRENDAVVRDFVAVHPDARENHMLQNNNIRAVMRQKPCGYQILPGTAGLDGFYFACLEKVS
jgi:16S rRNA (cytosine967-C5)-methyltransferase